MLACAIREKGDIHKRNANIFVYFVYKQKEHTFFACFVNLYTYKYKQRVRGNEQKERESFVYFVNLYCTYKCMQRAWGNEQNDKI